MRTLIAMAALPLLFVSSGAFAQEAEEAPAGAWEIDAEVGVHSDYRFRGISLSSKDPQVTAEVSVSHESGFYAGVWASNVALNTGADDVELDLFAGYAADLEGVSLDVGAVYYLYPGNSDSNYVEFLASVGIAVGPGTITVGAAYAPSQDNIGNQDNVYFYISGEMPIGETPLSLHGTFGIEDGAFGDNKRDWLIGASYDLGSGVTATVDYVDTARAFSPLGNATVVGRLTFAF
ncbi:MAG: TorF family putative porin [Sphingomonadaceae bacterium]